MKDRIEETIKNLRAAWGPLPIRTVPGVIDHLKHSIAKATEDRNVRSAIFSLFVKGLELQNLDGESFIDRDTAISLLQQHIDHEVTLYLLRCTFACPNTDPDRNVHDEDSFYDVFGAGVHKMLHADFEIVIGKAHYELDQLIEHGPDFMTNCEVKIFVIDNSTLVPMGRWLWDRKSSTVHWDEPVRQ
jgi:hypothetical protein